MPEARIVRSTRVVLPDGVRPAAILIEDGRIREIAADSGARGFSSASSAAPVQVADYGDLVISPGGVDTHVHVNEPGRTEWEGFDSATRAAAAGGVTTIVDMPLNSVPATTSVGALAAKRACASGRVHVDIAFWGGIVPGNSAEVEPLIDAGVRGFKCFLVPSGVDEFPPVDASHLCEVLPILARRNVPLLVHAEDPAVIAAHAPALSPVPGARPGRPGDATRGDDAAYAGYLASRPPEAEVAAIEMMARLCRQFGVRVHVVHVACADAIEVIARAKADGVPITAETCPHYLTFAAEEVPRGATEFKCAPPIRDARHRAALRNALQTGTLDLVASDHSPAPPAMKCAGDFQRAWGGIASIEWSLAATWSALAPTEPTRGVDNAALLRLARWTSEAPAALATLDRKGRIAAGFDADLTIWDPAAETTVDPMTQQQRHKLTPYAGRPLRGVVAAVYLRGACVWQNRSLGEGTRGRLL